MRISSGIIQMRLRLRSCSTGTTLYRTPSCVGRRTGSVQFSILRCRFGIGLNEALTHFSISSNECLEMTHDFITFAE